MQTKIKNRKAFKRPKYSKRNSRGFTLAEMTVSLGLFIIVLFITTSSFLSIVRMDRNMRLSRVATDNINLALEDMSRRIKTGTNYYCGGDVTSVGGQDCVAPGADSFAFTDQEGRRVSYRLSPSNSIIERQIGSEPGYTGVTSQFEMSIDGIGFMVSGSAPFPDRKQPMVTIVISGSLGTSVANSGFRTQTTVTQRAYDN